MNENQTNNNKPDEQTLDALKLRADVARQRLGRSINELSERLNPGEVTSGLVEWFQSSVSSIDTRALRDKSVSAGQTVARKASDNPVPLALLSLAVGSFFLPSKVKKPRANRQREAHEFDSDSGFVTAAEEDFESMKVRSGSSQRRIVTPAEASLDEQAENLEDYPDPWAHRHGMQSHGNGTSNGNGRTSAAKEKLSDAASAAGDRLKAVGSAANEKRKAAKETLSQAGSQLRENSSRAAEAAKRELGERPQMMAAAAFSLGIIGAMLLPRTRKEDKAFGEQAEQVRSKMTEAAEGMKKKAAEKLEEKDLHLEGLKERTKNSIDKGADKVKAKAENV